jgi:hypothetical protein
VVTSGDRTAARAESTLSVPLGPSHSFFVHAAAIGELHTLALDNASHTVPDLEIEPHHLWPLSARVLTVPWSLILAQAAFGLNTKHQLGRMRGASWDAFPEPFALPLEPGEHVLRRHLAAPTRNTVRDADAVV